MTLVAARENMVDSQVRVSDVSDPALQAAMRGVARERFCAPHQAELAYAEINLSICEGRWLLQPREAAKLLQAVRPREGERALSICEPYLAAVLARMGCEVTAVDTPAAVARVGAVLEEEGVTVATGRPEALDGLQGPYDVIVAGGAVSSAPQAWRDELANGGRLGAIVQAGVLGRAMVYVRSGDAITGRAAFDATPPYLPGMEPKAAFVL